MTSHQPIYHLPSDIPSKVSDHQTHNLYLNRTTNINKNNRLLQKRPRRLFVPTMVCRKIPLFSYTYPESPHELVDEFLAEKSSTRPETVRSLLASSIPASTHSPQQQQQQQLDFGTRRREPILAFLFLLLLPFPSSTYHPPTPSSTRDQFHSGSHLHPSSAFPKTTTTTTNTMHGCT
ncbi:hypothetical protein PGT21_015764 [Puccinia graminis f. sp. tritici]|uniref:Uncharacterized protein n=1 Tax=Puccinia graminis f. sp. tritici TaxID=56615 RepID=A0A5B0PR95_PUCGR|nr:hypothetical protein PGTUg99_036184 [Puccinia graminis f. sp. tritici]KAA1104237.1 hypothetical protein PGT21_015764 [Puccinia graminis f. sp. tritici]